MVSSRSAVVRSDRRLPAAPSRRRGSSVPPPSSPRRSSHRSRKAGLGGHVAKAPRLCPDMDASSSRPACGAGRAMDGGRAEPDHGDSARLGPCRGSAEKRPRHAQAGGRAVNLDRIVAPEASGGAAHPAQGGRTSRRPLAAPRPRRTAPTGDARRLSPAAGPRTRRTSRARPTRTRLFRESGRRPQCDRAPHIRGPNTARCRRAPT